MSDLNSLFAAARNDAPPEAVRDDVWLRIATETAAPAAAAAGAATVAAKTAAGTKLLALGALLGAAGATIAAIVITQSAPIGGAQPSNKSLAERRVPVSIGPEGSNVRLADATPRARAFSATSTTSTTNAPVANAPAANASAGVAASPAETSAWGVDDASALAEEARLVTEARSALLRGEAERALILVRSTRRLPVRALEPEELGLEARALRALGRSDEALATELRLKNKFPNHALSR